MTNEYTQYITKPDVFARDDEVIPYSPRRQFRFMEDQYNVNNNKTISLESMKNMSTDQIVELYKNGYTIENISQSQTPTIATATNDITVSSDAIFIISAGILLYMVIKK